MNSINDYYIQAQLAQAAYANLTIGAPDKKELQFVAGMSPEQARIFAENWRVVDQFNGISGASATVFENVTNNGQPSQRYLAIRGTQPTDPDDITADFVLAAGFPVFLNAQFTQLQTQVSDWLADGTLSTGFTVAGHSLGGYIATGIGSWFSESTDTYLFSAPGVGGLVGNVFDLLKTALGLGNIPLVSAVHNIRGVAGTSIIGGLGAQLSPVIPIEIEAAPYLGLGNHSVGRLTDALAVYALFSRITPALALEQIGNIILTSSNSNEQSLESAVQILAQLIIPGSPSIDNHDDLHQRLQDIEAELYINPNVATPQLKSQYQNLHIVDVAGLAGSAMLDNADGLAYRYALIQLNPFAITGSQPLYGQHNSQGELDAENFTEQYLADRARFLNLKTKLALTDSSTEPLPLTPEYFEDKALEIVIDNRKDSSTLPSKESDRYIFGSEIGDELLGSKKQDHLYGGSGDDLLDGKGGNNYLEGGLDNDTLLGGKNGNDTLNGGKGNDTYNLSGSGTVEIEDSKGADTYLLTNFTGQVTITDEDKSGDLLYINKRSTNQVFRAVDGAENTWKSFDGKDTITLSSSLSITDENGSTIVINDYQEGDFGLVLKDAFSESERTIQGDLAYKDFDSNAEGIQTQTDELGNIITVEGSVKEQADHLFGSENPDLIHSGAYDDTVNGKDGDDIIEGGSGSDILQGSAGDDRLYANKKTDFDTIFDTDTTEAGDTQDKLSGGKGDDQLIGSTGSDILSGGSGHDLLAAGAGNDKIFGDINNSSSEDDGADTIYAGGGEDEVWAGGGNDNIFGDSGQDKLMGEKGEDIIQGGNGTDILVGGAGDDYLFADSKDDFDKVFDSDASPAGDTRDWLTGGEGNDQLIGSTGGDALSGGAGNDLIAGGAGNDYILGDGDWETQSFDWTVSISENRYEFSPAIQIQEETAGSDAIYAGGGDDIVWAGGGHDNVFGDSGNDRLLGEKGDDNLLGDDGDDTLWGGEGDDILNGGNNDDLLYGENGNDTLLGGNGNDELKGGDGDDILNGGIGDDLLIGHSGNDTLLGKDGNDELQGHEGHDSMNGGAGNDILFGGLGQDHLNGGDDEDALLGEEDKDVLSGGQGNDELYGGEGDDDLFGGAGNDELFGDDEDLAVELHGNDHLVGGEGDDYLRGYGGDDTLQGGTDNDQLLGGEGSDTYLYKNGDGMDAIFDESGENDILRLQGIASGSVLIVEQDGFLTIFNPDTGDQVNIEDWKNSDSIEQIEFSDGIVWDKFTIIQKLEASGTSNIIQGTIGDDIIRGGSENDRIIADAGDDKLYGESGNDVMRGGSGNDRLYADMPYDTAPGNDTLYGGEGDDTLYGYEGTDTLYGENGNDLIYGSEGNDIINGGSGKDTLNGGDGDDQYLFGDGHGIDIINDKYGNNAIILASGISSSDISAYIDRNDLILALGSSQDQIRYKYFAKFNVDTGTYHSPSEAIEVRFADSTIWDANTLFSKLNLPTVDTQTGTDVDDTFIVNNAHDAIVEMPGSGIDTIESTVSYTLPENIENITLTSFINIDATGNDLNNILNGNSGSNVLDGKAGIDQYFGGGGDDFYIIDKENEFSNIVESENAGIDSIFYIGDDYLDVTLHDHVENMSLIFTSTFGFEHRSHFTGNSLDNVISVEPNSHSYNTGPNGEHLPVYFLSGEGGNDSLKGTLTADSLMGGSGDDYLYGGGDTDILNGGTGVDILVGGSGRDIYQLYKGDNSNFDELTSIQDGLDGSLLQEIRPGNIIQFGSDIVVGDIRFEESQGDLILHYSSSDKIRISNGANDTDGSIIDTYEFSNGVIYSHEEMMQWANADSLIFYNKGNGEVIISDQMGNDTLTLGDGIDKNSLDVTIETDPDLIVLSGQQLEISLDENKKKKVFSEVVALEDGGYVVKWIDRIQYGGANGTQISNLFFQVYDSNGNKIGDERVVDQTDDDYGDYHSEWGSVVALNNGGFAIIWKMNNSRYSPSDEVITHIYDNEGDFIGESRRVESSLPQRVISLEKGGYLAAWLNGTRDVDGVLSYVVKGEFFDNNGSLTDTFNFTPSSSGGYVKEFQVVELPDGGFVAILGVAHQFLGPTQQLHVQRFDNEGIKIGGETLIDNELENGPMGAIAVSALNDGNIVVTWSNSGDIYGRRLDSQGNKLGSAFLINNSEDYELREPMITTLDDGGFLVVWWSSEVNQQDGDIYAQRFSAAGNKMGEEFKVNENFIENQSASSITTLKKGDIIVTWNLNQLYDQFNGYSFSRIFGQRIAMGNDLHITFNDTSNDEIVIKNWSEDGRIENFQFADSTTLSDVDINNLLDGGTSTNQAPQAQDDNLTTDEDQLLVIAPPTLLGNDTDLEGDSLNISTVNNAVNGIAALDAESNVVFMPAADFNGVASFEYEVSDSHGGNSRAKVNITVNAVNDVPTVNTLLIEQTIEEGSPFKIILPADTFIDIDTGDSLILTATLADSSALPNWFSFDANTQSLSGTPPLDAEGQFSVKVTATDSLGLTVDSSFTLTVNDSKPEIVGSSGDDTLNGTEYDDIIDSGDGNDRLYAREGNDMLEGGAGNDILNGGNGGDFMAGGVGDDKYYVDNLGDSLSELANEGNDRVYSSIDFALDQHLEQLVLTGEAALNGVGNSKDNWLYGNSAANVLSGAEGNDRLYGRDGNDTLQGGVGNDILNGGNGADAMTGGVGDDKYYVDNLGDSVSELANGGNDRVYSSIDYTLDQHLEQLVLTGEAALNGVGNSKDNRLYGNSAANVLSGAEGNDRVYGRDGNDTLQGGAGNDILNGGSGADAMTGGVGDDKYYVDNLGDSVSELANGGNDRVYSSIDYTLDQHLEQLVLTGETDLKGIGNSEDNRLYGNSGANMLSGADGNDRLYGRDGNDTLQGGAGNDILNGGNGADAMTGGVGGDKYYVDNLGDSVSELANGGNDRVYSSIDYTLDQHLEQLVLTGETDLKGIGNSEDNRLYGNNGANMLSGADGNDRLYGRDGNDTLQGGTGNDILNGGSGADVMTGSIGDDKYYVDNLGDNVLESVDEGNDRVYSSIDYALDQHLEQLVLTGEADLNGAGNSEDNRLFGNSGANELSGAEGDDRLYGRNGNDTLQGSVGNDILNGGNGADAMAGGIGDDKYYVDNLGDILLESVGEGNDRVYSSIDYALGQNLEQLALTGKADLNGVGNSEDNRLYGNSGANELSGAKGNDRLYARAGNDILMGAAGNDYLNGGDGNDQLRGGDGNDTLNGGQGGDTYFFNLGDARDEITDSGSIDNVYQDVLKFGEGISTDDLWFSRKTNDLVIDHIGNDDQVQIKNWFSSTNNQIEQITVDNAVLHSNQVINLVNAMSAFNAPSGSGAIVPQDVQEQLAPVLAASWTPAT